MTDLFQAHRERVGGRLREVRIEQRKSHDRVAAAVGTSRQHLIKIEKGTHMPGPALLAALAAELGKDTSFFTDDDEEDSSMPSYHDLLDALRPLGELFSKANA